MCSQNRPAMTHLLSVTRERPWPIDDRICGFYADFSMRFHADMRISIRINHNRICAYEKQPHPYLYQHMKLYVTRPSSSPLKF